MIQKAKTKTRKSPSMSPNLPKRNFKVKADPEWESLKKSLAASTKKKASNLKPCPNPLKPRPLSETSFAIQSFSKMSTTKMRRPWSQPWKKKLLQKLKPSSLKEKTAMLCSLLSLASTNAGRSSMAKTSSSKLTNMVTPLVNWPWCTTLQELLPSKSRLQESFTLLTE